GIARSRAQRDCTTSTLETFTTAKAVVRGVPVVASYSLSAIGTSSANGISETVDVDLAAMKSQGDLKMSVAIGVRDDCQCVWNAATSRRFKSADMSAHSKTSFRSQRLEASEHLFCFSKRI